MTSPLDITLKLLTKTRNEAADAVLLPALDSPRPEIRDGALRALLERGSVEAQRYAVAHLHTFDAEWRALVNEYRGRMSIAIRDAVLSPTPSSARTAASCFLQFRDYELTPALVNAAEDETNPNRGPAAHTLLQLAELLYEELAAPSIPTAAAIPSACGTSLSPRSNSRCCATTGTALWQCSNRSCCWPTAKTARSSRFCPTRAMATICRWPTCSRTARGRA